MNLNGKWFSIFPPGWPAVLALGFAAGLPAIVNPLIAGATILVLYPFLRRLYGPRVANVACALLALSPMFLFMSGGVMAHPLSALCVAGAAAALHRAWDERSPLFAILAGALLGWLALTRPFEGMLLCAAFGLYGLTRWTYIRERRAVLVSLLLPIAAVAIGALILPYFAALTGRAFDDPVTKYFDTHYYPRSNRLGFGSDIANFGWGTDFLPGHSPLEGALNAQLSSQLIHFELFGWPMGSWAPIVLYLLWRRDVWAREDALFLTTIIVVVLGQACYWYAGADYGARYWYQLLIPCCVLAAKALTRELPDRSRLAPAALVMSLIAVAIFVPWRGATKYVGYRGMNDSVARLVRECPMTDGLVFVRGTAPNTPFGIYSAAAILNDPGFRSDAPIFARDTSPDGMQAVRTAFPDRPVWTIDVPQDPRGIARVVEMPASAPDGCRDAAARGTK
jgi:4-amino-4-deoxy-L-arabinose transferase-like glycosyltransferase